MKKFFTVFISGILLAVNISNGSESPAPLKKILNSDFGRLIRQSGGVIEYVDTYETSSQNWKVAKFYIYSEKDILKQPLVVFYNPERNIMVLSGLIIENGKIVKPLDFIAANPEFRDVSIEIVRSFRTENRTVYNPDGIKTLYFFYDPDCEFCLEMVQKLKRYRGIFRVVRKWFPLEQIHPGAKKMAIKQQTDELKIKGFKNDARAEAEKIVNEDIEDALKIGISATPIFVSEDGKVYPNVPDMY